MGRFLNREGRKRPKLWRAIPPLGVLYSGGLSAYMRRFSYRYW